MLSGFQVSAWTNGPKAARLATFGLNISGRDRDAHLKREWGTVDIHLPSRTQPVTVNVDKDSLWTGDCLHVIKSEIGEWLKSEALAPWPRGCPPKFMMIPLGGRKFEVRRL